MELSDLEGIAEDVGTPTYVYSEERIRGNYCDFYSAFKREYGHVKVLYAYKANSSLAICRLLAGAGAGADVVSSGELETAIRAGVSGSDIIFSNNAKTKEDLEKALKHDAVINVDSPGELELLQKVAAKKKKRARVSFRLNPGIDPKTHPKIATGLKDSKFGLHIEGGIARKAYESARNMGEVEIVGAHTHIGSQITSVGPYVDAAEKLMEFVHSLKKDLGITLEFVDLGGGLGIPYQGETTATPEDLAEGIVPVIKRWNERMGYAPELWLEPGRFIVADSGALLCTVVSVKETPYKKFINLDAGFNTLVRPAMYDAYHRIKILGKEKQKPSGIYDIVGNVCESGDVFAKDRELPEVREGDIAVILDAGAYGYSMASRYNSRPMPAEVLLKGHEQYEIIREREPPEELYRGQKIPQDLE